MIFSSHGWLVYCHICDLYFGLFVQGRGKVQAIHMFPPPSPSHSPSQSIRRVCRNEVFEKLPNLRMFHARDVIFAGDFQNSFSELRWLRWYVNDMCWELTNFHLGKLIILELINCHISKHWATWSSMKVWLKLHKLGFGLVFLLKKETHIVLE